MKLSFCRATLQGSYNGSNFPKPQPQITVFYEQLERIFLAQLLEDETSAETLPYLTSTVLLDSWSNMSKASAIVFCNSAAEESDDSAAGFSGSLLGFGEPVSAILISSLVAKIPYIEPALSLVGGGYRKMNARYIELRRTVNVTTAEN